MVRCCVFVWEVQVGGEGRRRRWGGRGGRDRARSWLRRERCVVVEWIEVELVDCFMELKVRKMQEIRHTQEEEEETKSVSEILRIRKEDRKRQFQICI